MVRCVNKISPKEEKCHKETQVAFLIDFIYVMYDNRKENARNLKIKKTNKFFTGNEIFTLFLSFAVQS